jgi:hypothetical protein
MMEQRYKTPICKACGRQLKGFVPVLVEVICFHCSNPNPGEQDEDTNWKDKQ